MNTVLPLRVTLLAESPALIHRIYRAYWAEDRDISSPEVIREICDEVGLDGACARRALAGAGGEGRAPASDGRSRGGGSVRCADLHRASRGEPSLFWGADRLEWAARRAAGDDRLR